MTVEEPKNDEQPTPNDNNNMDVEYSDLYPGRKQSSTPRSWLSKLFLMEKQEEIDKLRCEMNVYDCVRNSKFIIFISMISNYKISYFYTI